MAAIFKCQKLNAPLLVIFEKSGNIVIVRNGGHFEMAAILKISKVECTPLSDALLMCEISAHYLKGWRKKVRKTDLLRYSKSKKGHNSFKIWRNLTKRELDLWLVTTKPYTKFQLNTLKHKKKKCGKTVRWEGREEEEEEKFILKQYVSLQRRGGHN